MKVKQILILLAAVLTLNACTRQPAGRPEIERQLIELLCVEETKSADVDRAFKIIERNPQTLDFDMRNVCGLDVLTTAEGDMKVYLIEDHVLYQYRIGDKVYVHKSGESEYEPIAIAGLLELNDDDAITKYAIIERRLGEDYDLEKTRIRMIEISKSGLRRCNEVFVSGGKTCNELSVECKGFSEDVKYDLDSNYSEVGDDVKGNPVISFNLFNNVVNIARVKNQDVHYAYYWWDYADGKFKDVTLIEPKELQNDDYYIRIEQEPDGSCTYMCWNGEKTGDPNMVIKKGKRGFLLDGESTSYNESPNADDFGYGTEGPTLYTWFEFQNGGYLYRFEAPVDSHADPNINYGELTVKDPMGKEIYSEYLAGE